MLMVLVNPKSDSDLVIFTLIRLRPDRPYTGAHTAAFVYIDTAKKMTGWAPTTADADADADEDEDEDEEPQHRSIHATQHLPYCCFPR